MGSLFDFRSWRSLIAASKVGVATGGPGPKMALGFE